VTWLDPATLGYPALALGVLIGSIVPVIPTGAVVGAAAAVALTTDHLWLPFVIAVAALAAWVGDIVTYAIARLGSAAAVTRIARGQSAERLATARATFEKRGWPFVVIGRLVPAGRIPSLLAAAAFGYPWRKLAPAAAAGAVVWAAAYSVLGVVSGGIFDDPVVASLIAAGLVLVVSALAAWIANIVRRRRA
jgi:membrane protein DedA with SNARE-associated domain